MSGIFTKIQRQPAWLALFIVVLLTLWVMSGRSSNAEASGEQEDKAISLVQRVQVTKMFAEQVSREVQLYGRTEPARMATLRAEINGRVLEILAQEGAAVSKGQPLFRIDANDLRERIASAEANLQRRIIEMEGAKALKGRGYQSQVALMQAQADVAEAEASLRSLRIDFSNTTVVAPFDGVVNQHFAEVGDYLRDGDQIAMIVDLDPLVIKADVTESDVQSLELGQEAQGRLVSGQDVSGTIRYISSVSQEGTNTFRIEVQVPNGEAKYLAGMSTQLSIPLQSTWAMKVTPALMALDEQGNIGIKTVTADNNVKFVPIDMVKSDSTAVWLAGLGQQADIITLGQGFVRHGDPVEVVQNTALTQTNPGTAE